MSALAIAGFEFKRCFWRLSTYVYWSLFFVIAFLLTIAAGGAFSSVSVGMGAGGKVLVNSPYTLQSFITLVSYFGLLITASVAGQSVYQDFHSNSHAFFFTAPISERQYLTGRFLSALLISCLIFSSVGAGCWAGSRMFFVEHSLFGPNRFMAYLQPYLIAVLPNLLFTTALFFSLAALTRKIAPVYVASVVLLIGYLIGSMLFAKLENRGLAALVDPFGMQASGRLTEYWTIAEKNARLVPLSGILLANRLLWLGLGAVLLAVTFWRFRFAHPVEGGRARAPESEPSVEAASAVPAGGGRGPSRAAQLFSLTRLAFRETVKNVYFAVIVLAGVLFMAVASTVMGNIYGTGTWPVTYEVLDVVGGSFGLFMIIIITIYSGELVWREREARVDQLHDALPIPTWLPLAAKLIALVALQAVLLFVIMIGGVVIQTLKGYYHYEWSLYIKELFGLRLIDFTFTCVLAVLIQVLVNQKYLGHFIMVLYYIVSAFMARFGFEHHLYRYGSTPEWVYSDMNGYGHFLKPVFYFDVYWAAFAVLLALASNLFWVRGVEPRWRRRVGTARARITRPVALAASAALALWLGVGTFIYYNTNVLNTYRVDFARDELRAQYEKQHKALERVAQPRITAIALRAEVYPAERALAVRGTYALTNKTAEPIPAVYVELDPDDVAVRRLAIAGVERPSAWDERAGLRTFTLPVPLEPGATATLELDLDYRSKGFKNGESPTSIVENGTFFSSGNLPQIGYQPDAELTDDDVRRKHGLQPKPRMADVEDASARRNTYVSNDADWLDLTITVGTSEDQLGIAPGALEREWREGGRRYFQYRTPKPVLNLFAVQSARYRTRRDRWNDVDIEIDYHPGHEYDLDAMIKGVKRALEYCTKSFGPYQHKMVRIVEFPRYQQFAQSLPNTIPYSESIGFIARVDPRDEKDVDYPFYVTAHEVAHQWWAHQVIGGNVQGSTMLSETMAQYSALMVMKHEFGLEMMKRFLRYELDRYLLGRSIERKKELPLVRVENQPYIHYQKGSLVMYALQDYIGEDTVNRALSTYLHKVAYQSPPYTNSLELLAYLKEATPPDRRYLIEDLFETITLYDNRAVEARYTPNGKGYDVTLTLSAKKLRADELGAEHELPLDDLIEVGVYGEGGKLLALEKRRLRGEENIVTLNVSEVPVKAGIDPLNELIDRRPDDNVIAVTRD